MVQKDFQEYFKGLNEKHETGTEFTPRTDFENLLNSIKPSKKIKIIQEPKKDENISGRPDFKVEISGMAVGYIETKALNINLEDILSKKLKRESEQLDKYLKIIDNLILTNYNEFILFKNGKPFERGLLFYPGIDKKLDTNNVSKIADIFKNFFTVKPKRIESPKKLSHLLAERTKLFKDFLEEFLENGEENQFKMRLIGEGGLRDLIRDILIEDLTTSDFIDAYVQTITYGLFLAEINSKEQVSEDNAARLIPESMGIIRDLFRTIDIADIPDSVEWIIEEIIDILKRVDDDKLKKNLSFSKIYDFEDPYVYFYENFLGDYDKNKRKSKGVYYTPIPVVKFIVESIDYLIRENFNSDGLKGSNVKILDFATGTGTFLLEAFIKALKDTDDGMKEALVHERLLKNFYGFEYLIAPYTIAHLKLSQYLKESGYPLKDDERLNIYLTDTLDNSKHHAYAYFQKMTKEGIEASKIKLDEDILVLMGNPPYSSKSKNNKEWILKLCETYKKGLNEKNIQPLNDDYIKFIRYAHWKIEKKGKGIIGIISNNSYLDGVIHRIMRKELIETFDQIYILNLHGDKRKGDLDDNVFDILTGVSIALFVKLSEPLEQKELYYYSTLEKKIMDRELKYGFLFGNDINTLQWTKLEVNAPNYWFKEKDLSFGKEYNEFWGLTEIFNEYKMSLATGKDKLFINMDKKQLIKEISSVLSGEIEALQKYNIESSPDKKIRNFKNSSFDENFVRTINYRLFDTRWIYYDPKSIQRARFKLMNNFIVRDNLGIIFPRQVSKDWKHIFITNKIVERTFVSSKTKEGGYLAPLYIQSKEKNKDKQITITGSKEPVEIPYNEIYPNLNFTKNFLEFISTKYINAPSPEEILGYIYAILHSKTYRERYNEFLKTDFPRIPFTDNLKIFKQLSKYGLEMIELHLLEKTYSDSDIAKYPIKGDNIVNKIRYDKENCLLYINKTQYFENVSEEVWNMEIGSYKVLDKWLKYRNDRELSFEDIYHFQKVIRALNDTIGIMDKIDEAFVSLDSKNMHSTDSSMEEMKEKN